MSEYESLVQAENLLPEVTMADVDTVRGIKSNGDSIEIPKENFRLDDTQIDVDVVGVTATTLDAALLEVVASIDDLDTDKATIVYVDQQDALKADKATLITAGAGLTGGGDLSASRTLNVATANDGITINADNIELATIDNLTTASTTKPLSANQGKHLEDNKIDISTKGQANGVAPLGADSLISSAYLPSYVDDMVEGYYRVSNGLFYEEIGYINLIAGATGKIYVSLDTNKQYRWSGSAFVYITSGAVDSVAGKTGIVSLVKADVGLGNVDNTTDANKPISTLQAAGIATKVGLTGNETVAGVKTFSSSPIVPTPTTGTQAVNIDYVTSALTTSLPVATALLSPWYAMYTRWLADTGTQFDKNLAEQLYLSYLNSMPETVFLFNLHVASKIRAATAQRFVNKAYDLSTNNYDAVQATEATQPYATANASPLSKVGVKYVQGQTQTGLLDFTDKAFLTTDSWTLTTAFRANKKGTTTRIYLGAAYIDLTSSTVVLHNGTDAVLTGTHSLECGKTAEIEFQYSNGVGLIKVNNNPVATTAALKAITFGQFSLNTSFPFDGILYHVHLTNTRKSEQQSQLDYTFLRSMYPEIEGVNIDYQHWANSNFEATVDGAGNVIAEVQNATATEQMTNPTFTGGATDWTLGAGITYGTDDIAMTAATSTAKQTKTLIAGRYYRVTTIVTAISGGSCNALLGAVSGISRTTTGTFIDYLKATTGTDVGLNCVGMTGTVTSCSVELLGWADSTVLNTALLAAPYSLTALQATVASGMWCYYNNDPAFGAIYGKLYNWYAVIQIASNPPKGWRVPSNADFIQLSTFLGGDTVSGGKMKTANSTYMTQTTPGSNESGFTGLGGGSRTSTGSFSGILTLSAYHHKDTELGRAMFHNTLELRNAGGYYVTAAKIDGFALRLLRNEPNGRDIETIMTTTTVDIASSALTIVCPPMYRLKDIGISSVNALTTVAANMYDYANTTLIGNVLTKASHAAGADITYEATQIDTPTPYVNRTLRITAAGNTNGQITVRCGFMKLAKAPQ